MNASAEALSAPPPLATPQDVAAGEQFVVNLCSSTTPMALVQPQGEELRRFTFFVSRRREEGRERFRLHMGYFASAADAESWLNVVRDVYPAAWVGEAPGKKLRAAAAAREAAAQSGNPAPVSAHVQMPADLPPLPTLEVPALSASAAPLPAAPTPAARPPATPVAAASVPPKPTAASGSPSPSPSPSAATASVSPKPVATPRAAVNKTPAPAIPTDSLSNVREVIAALDAEPAPRASGAPAFVPTVQAAPVQFSPQPVRAAAKLAQAASSAAKSAQAASSTAKPAQAAAKPAQPLAAKPTATSPAVPSARPPAAPARPAMSASPGKAATKSAPNVKPQGAPVAKPAPAPAARSPAPSTPAVPTSRAPALPAAPAPKETPPSLSDSQVLRVLEERGIAQAEGERDLAAESAIMMLRPEDTQTMRALKNDVRENAPAQFAVQLDWSVTPIDIAKLPPLAIFSAYTLYTVEASREGRRWYGLRLGFFTDAISAKQVAYYVRSDFASVAVVPVSSDEKSRATHDSHDAAQVGTGAREERKAEEFKLFDLEPAAADSDPAKAPVPAEIAAAARAGLAAARSGAARPGAATKAPLGRKPSPRPLRKKAPSETLEQTLEQTLEILGASDLSIDKGRGELLNDTGVRHLSVKLDKRTSTFSKLLDRLSDRLGGR